MVAASAAPAEGGNPPFRIRGALTITRAASIQREIDAEADPLLIDLSGVERMDTVGAWLVYRAMRDRGAKLAGASPESQSLLDQVAEFDKPVQVRPEEPATFLRMIGEIGEWIAESGRTIVGLLGFFGATLVGMANVILASQKIPPERGRPAV
jgi:phospholipid/cholesterol/gamma-HCH transport system permease protein